MVETKSKADEEELVSQPGSSGAGDIAKVTPRVLDELLSTIDQEILKFIKMVESHKTAGEGTEPRPDAAEVVEPVAAPSLLSETAAEIAAEELPGAEFESEAPALSLKEAAAEVPEAATVLMAGAQIIEDTILAIDQELAAAPTLEFEGLGGRAAEPGAREEAQFIIFSLEDTDYAVAAGNVMEVGEVLTITPLPNVPHWVAGVANLRGDIISMVDLRLFFGLEQSGSRASDRMLVCRDRNAVVVVGLLVDRVSAIRFLSLQAIGEPTAPIDDRLAPYLRGVLEYEGRMVVVLDFDKLLLAPEMQQFQAV